MSKVPPDRSWNSRFDEQPVMTIDRSEVAGTEITIGPQNVELDRF